MTKNAKTAVGVVGVVVVGLGGWWAWRRYAAAERRRKTLAFLATPAGRSFIGLLPSIQTR